MLQNWFGKNRVYFWIKWEIFDWTTAISITWSHDFSKLISQIKICKVLSRFILNLLARWHLRQKTPKTEFLTGWCNRIDWIINQTDCPVQILTTERSHFWFFRVPLKSLKPLKVWEKYSTIWKWFFSLVVEKVKAFKWIVRYEKPI